MADRSAQSKKEEKRSKVAGCVVDMAPGLSPNAYENDGAGVPAGSAAGNAVKTDSSRRGGPETESFPSAICSS
jgi:hypothetical protein